MNKYFYVYILTNMNNKVLYVGVTNDLMRRIDEHKRKLVKGFTSKYNVNKLVYYEEGQDSHGAIIREKQLKRYGRFKKLKLIESKNPNWDDLYEKLLNEKFMSS